MKHETLSLGFFDGVHLGHRAILAGVDRVLTFTNHPLSVLAPARPPRLMMSLDARLAAIRACGVAEVCAIPFTPALAQLEATEFFARYASNPSACTIRCGESARFGRGGGGKAATLRAAGYTVEVVPSIQYANEPISSSRIRAALEEGALDAASAMLGRPFEVVGRPEAGKGLGRHLGFPTENLNCDESLELRLPRGVYVVTAGDAWGVANYGLAPTAGEAAWASPRFEVHYLSREFPSSASVRTIALRAFLRPERAFATWAELKGQIEEDIKQARRIKNDLV